MRSLTSFRCNHKHDWFICMCYSHSHRKCGAEGASVCFRADTSLTTQFKNKNPLFVHFVKKSQNLAVIFLWNYTKLHLKILTFSKISHRTGGHPLPQQSGLKQWWAPQAEKSFLTLSLQLHTFRNRVCWLCKYPLRKFSCSVYFDLSNNLCNS